MLRRLLPIDRMLKAITENSNSLNLMILRLNCFPQLLYGSELAELKQLPYKLEINSLRELLKTDKMRLYIVNDKNNNPIAARIINLNFPYSSDVFAANSLEARNCGATYFIMQRIFETLKEEEFKTFDFGRIPPSSHATDSVYVFKNASRGNKIQYNGEWVHYKSNLIELMMSFYKLFKLKKQRY